MIWRKKMWFFCVSDGSEPEAKGRTERSYSPQRGTSEDLKRIASPVRLSDSCARLRWIKTS